MKKIIIISIILFYSFILFGQKIGIQGNLNLTNLETFKRGSGIELYSEIGIGKKISIIPSLGYNSLVYSNHESISSNGSTMTIDEKATTHWYQIGVAGVYNILKKGKFNFKLGPEINYIFFPAHKGILSNKIILEAESRISSNLLLNFQLTELFNTKFGIDIKTNIGYMNKSNDNNNNRLIRPWNGFINYKFQIGVFYELGNKE